MVRFSNVRRRSTSARNSVSILNCSLTPGAPAVSEGGFQVDEGESPPQGQVHQGQGPVGTFIVPMT